MATTITATEAASVAEYEAKGQTQLDIADVMRMLCVSRQSVQKLIDSRELPSFKVGKSVKIPIAGYKKFIAKALGN